MMTQSKARGKVQTVNGKPGALYAVELNTWTDATTAKHDGETVPLYDWDRRPGTDGEYHDLGQNVTIGHAIQHSMVGQFSRFYYLYRDGNGERGVGEFRGSRLCVLHDPITDEILRRFRD